MKRTTVGHSLGRIIPVLLLLLIVLAAFALRVWGTGFGLPAYTRYHPDEHALVDRAAAILWTGDWNLHRFNYPAFYAYVQAGAYADFQHATVCPGHNFLPLFHRRLLSAGEMHNPGKNVFVVNAHVFWQVTTVTRQC